MLTTQLVAADYSIIVEDSNPPVAAKILVGLEAFNIDYFKQRHGEDRDSLPFVIYATDGEGLVIGGLSGGIFGTWAYVDYASVEPVWQKQGVGTKLFMKLEEHLKSHNCTSVQLFTWEYQAVDFYKKLGYKCVGTIPNWIENTYDAYFFKKELMSTFELTWENPATVSAEDIDDLRQMMTRSFFLCYRAYSAFQDRTDEELLAYLESYFDTFIVPRLKEPGLFLFARNENRIVGFALFEKMAEDQIYVAELAIDADFWKQGLGRRLMSAIIEKEPSTKKIFLLTQWLNKGAQGFYEALGYQPSSFTHEGYSPEEYRAYELILNTPAPL